MKRFVVVAAVSMASLVAIPGVTGTALSAPNATKAKAQAAGWDCSPDVTILGFFHCAAPGRPTLLDLITGTATPPSLSLNVYDGTTEAFSGTEMLIRADLFAGQACPHEGEWSFLDFAGADYWGCHHSGP